MKESTLGLICREYGGSGGRLSMVELAIVGKEIFAAILLLSCVCKGRGLKRFLVLINKGLDTPHRI